MATANFDFSKYNEIMKPANSGLKLYLALRLLEDVENTMRRFDSPFKDDAIKVVDAVVRLRAQNKVYLASRDKAIDDKARELAQSKAENTTDGKLDSMEHLKVATKSGDYAKDPA